MARPSHHPFAMLPARGAQSRRPGGRILDGRASFVWLYGVLLPIACELAPNGVEIRRRSPDGPWHLVTMTPDEALAELQHYKLQRASFNKMVATHRAKNARKREEQS